MSSFVIVKNKHLTKAIGGIVLFTSSICHGAWLFDPPVGADFQNAPAVGSFVLPTTGANYDPTNLVDQRGFDTTPQALDFSYTVAGDEPIAFTFTGGSFIDIDIDPDNDDVYPTSFTFTVNYDQAVRSRNLFNGGGTAGTPQGRLGTTIDVATQFVDGNGDLIDVSTLNFGSLSYSPANPGDTTAIGTGITNFARVRPDGSTLTALPFDSTDPAQSISSQTSVISNFVFRENDEAFRISFDGGVSIPEPSSSLLIFLGAIGLIRRRR